MFGTTAVQHAVPKELTSHTHMDDINFTMQFEQEEEEEEEELHQGLLGESGCIVAQLKIHARLQCLQLLGNCRSTVNMLPNASQHANISQRRVLQHSGISLGEFGVPLEATGRK